MEKAKRRRPGPGPTRVAARYTATAEAAAAVVIVRYSHSFSLATRLLPVRVRSAVASLYALVRVADEVVDGACPAEYAERALGALEAETTAAIDSGFSTNPVVHAFAQVARWAGFGTELTAPFFASMRADLHPTPHTQESLAAYIEGSAEVVGLMCLRVFLRGTSPGPGHGYAELEPGARALGAALQKINFLRDMADDGARLGRDYFPQVAAATMTNGEFDALVADAAGDLAAGADAAELLPADVRVAVRTAVAIYRDLLERIRVARPGGVHAARIRVPRVRKLRLALSATRRTRRVRR